MQRYTIIIFAVFIGAYGAPQAKHHFGGRIVNGTEAQLGEYPFMVSLQYPNREHFCGGSILNEYYILTAAHCVAYDSPSYLSALVGSVNIQEGGQSYDVDTITVHEGYDEANNVLNDIAVVKLKSAISFNENVQPVKLPAQMEPTPGGTPATVLGFGRIYENGPMEDHLQQVNITIYSDQECQDIYYYMSPYDSNICAGVPEGGKGQCNGDSGGPLIANGHQVGIVSWGGKPCAKDPGVCTEVAYYIDWLVQHADVH
ncbi:chymotrypsin-2-like [Periplaneta americana]|uniref:chymotrypsin-2-like n=1 Tax=Periplaneta americana TaxID=6978 RepID=UPI0037E91706